MGVCNCYMFCCTLLYVHSSFAIILVEKRELVALPGLSSWCLVTLVMVVWLFFAVPWVCLRFVIVVFPDHTHYFCASLLLVQLAMAFFFILLFLKCSLWLDLLCNKIIHYRSYAKSILEHHQRVKMAFLFFIPLFLYVFCFVCLN